MSAYPALMAYITDRSRDEQASHWCNRLREDEAAARLGEFADVVADLRRAEADYGSYPSNAGMGRFLDLPLDAANEPPHGYYMARQVAAHYSLGVATREADELIKANRPLKIVAARSKATGKPVRFHTFVGPEQVRIEGNCVVIRNGKVRGRLESNWSVETALQRAAEAMRTGVAYGCGNSASA